MQILNPSSQAEQCFLTPRAHATARRGLPYRRFVLKLLLSILGSAILVSIGPVTLGTVAQASLVLIQIFLGLCRLGLTILQIFRM
jgi:hypothetical protein